MQLYIVSNRMQCNNSICSCQKDVSDIFMEIDFFDEFESLCSEELFGRFLFKNSTDKVYFTTNVKRTYMKVYRMLLCQKDVYEKINANMCISMYLFFNTYRVVQKILFVTTLVMIYYIFIGNMYKSYFNYILLQNIIFIRQRCFEYYD